MVGEFRFQVSRLKSLGFEVSGLKNLGVEGIRVEEFGFKGLGPGLKAKEFPAPFLGLQTPTKPLTTSFNA